MIPANLDILTERLALRPMTPAFLEASLAGSREIAAEMLGCSVPDAWFGESERDLARLRLDGLNADPEYQEWSLRAIIERAGGRMVGHAGFHTRPGAAYLADWAPDGVELGFAIEPPFRRKGYAHEAALGLIRWAAGARGVSQFVASVAPGNVASLSLVQALGFVPIGRQLDEFDGEEIVLRLAGAPLRSLLAS